MTPFQIKIRSCAEHQSKPSTLGVDIRNGKEQNHYGYLFTYIPDHIITIDNKQK